MSNVVIFQPPPGNVNIFSMPFDRATISRGCCTVTAHVALYAGSSKHGANDRVDAPPSKSVLKIHLDSYLVKNEKSFNCQIVTKRVFFKYSQEIESYQPGR